MSQVGQLRRMRLRRVSLVSEPASQEKGTGFGAFVCLYKAEWSQAQINDLPDSAFAVVESGGKKDDDGKTTPRSLRHFPFKNADGKVDLPHLRNALARLPQSKLAADLKAKAAAKLRAAAQEAGVKADMPEDGDGDLIDSVACAACGYKATKDAKYCAKCGASMKAAGAAGKDNNMQELEKVKGDLAAAEGLLKEEGEKREALEKRLATEKAEAEARIKAAETKAAETAAEVQKLKDEREVVEFVAKAKNYPNLPLGTADEFGAILRKISKALTVDEFKKFEESLAGANSAAEPLYGEKGHSGSQGGGSRSAAEEIDTKVQEAIKASGGKLDEAKAMAQLSKTHPNLFKSARASSYTDERRANES